jgi:hypothetical protein
VGWSVPKKKSISVELPENISSNNSAWTTGKNHDPECLGLFLNVDSICRLIFE